MMTKKERNVGDLKMQCAEAFYYSGTSVATGGAAVTNMFVLNNGYLGNISYII